MSRMSFSHTAFLINRGGLNPRSHSIFCNAANKMHYVYIIQSDSTNRYYIGSTQDLTERIDGHNSGKTTSTRKRGPWKLVYHEEFETKTEALKREREIKRKKSAESIRRILSNSQGVPSAQAPREDRGLNPQRAWHTQISDYMKSTTYNRCA